MADFDPEAFLRATEKKPPAEPPAAFDPEAFLRSTVPQVTAGETYVNQAVNTLPLGRMLTNLLSTGVVQGAKALGAGRPGVRMTPEAMAEAQAQGLPVNEESAIPGMLDTYRQLRDTRDARVDAGNAQNPTASKLGTGTGIALQLLAPMPKALGGAGLGSQAATAARTGSGTALRQLMTSGAKMGALQAAGDSRADLTSLEPMELVQQGAETLLGGGIGALGAPLGLVAGKAAAPVLRGVGSLLRRGGINLGRRALLAGADTLSSRLPLRDEAVEEALKSGAILPLGTAKGAFGRLTKQSDAMGQVYGDIINGLEARGVQGPEAVSVAEELMRRAEELAPNTMNEALPQRFKDAAQTLLRRVDTEPGYLGLKQSENLKRSLQDMARYGRLEETPLNEVNREIASVVREANEKAIEEAASKAVDPEIIERAESFVPVKQRLGRLMEAESAAQRGMARESTRSPISMYDLVLGTMGGGDLGKGAALVLASKFLRPRLPSTGAAASYWGGRGLQDLATLATRDALPAGAARAASAVERQQLSDWLAEQTGASETAEALRRRRR